MKSILHKIPYVRRLVHSQGAFKAGHYYSPIPDREDIFTYIPSRKKKKEEIPDVEINKESQFRLLQEFSEFYKDLPFPEKKKPKYRYYYNNDFFYYSDAVFLYCFLRKNKPKRIIEIGSGFSSAAVLDTVDHIDGYNPDIHIIDPHFQRLDSLLKDKDRSKIRIINKRIQEVPADIMFSLEEGDLLFIDSSHVIKSGSDLHKIMFEILPFLSSGVYVHFHDIFYPFEYPLEWLQKGIFWNESYFVHAFLSYNSEWKIYFFSSYVEFSFDDFIKKNMPLCTKSRASSLYIKRGDGEKNN